jgi:HK97 family phage major capsid protein
MKLTALLKKWAVENLDVEKDASDDEFRKAIGLALATEKLSMDDYTKMATDPEDQKATDVLDRLDGMAKGLEKLTGVLSNQQTQKAEEKEVEEKESEVKEPEVVETKEDPETKETQPSWLKKIVSTVGGGDTTVDPSKEGEVRVKGSWEQYDSTKSAAIFPEYQKSGRRHPLAGKQMKNMGRPIDDPSELDQAVSGAYAKFMCATAQYKSRSLAFGMLNQHDRELLYYAMEHYKWSGASDGGLTADIIDRPLKQLEMKALIDDATSGGLEAAPIVFDDLVIQAPLLNGELFPLVNTIPLDRGRRVEGVSVGTVTGSWGGIDDTAISLFNTNSYVSAFDTTIFRWEGAIHIGLDFLSDTPIDFNALITAQYGERLLEDLDDVIADGNGTTQPEGVIQKSGIGTVNFAGTTSLGNYESLRFGVAKAEHRANVNQTAVFCGTETSYQRVRAIPVGASDARRIFGMDYDSYAIMNRPYKINETLTNAEIFYAILGRYRMYRRRGLVIRSSTEGDTLIRNNAMLLVAMARYGGQLERGAAGVITTTAPA